MLRTCLLVLILMPLTAFAQQKTPEQKVREDRAKVEAEAFWIYNNIPRGFEEAKRTGKPLLVVLRCLPCQECVKLDDDLIDQDPVVRPLLGKFVCVRQVSTNGLDLSLFQFDTDQSFATFMLNADGTIYGRFGTRSHRSEWIQDVSVEGLARALEGALELHTEYPKNKASLALKRGPAPSFPSPEKFPSLKDKYTDAPNYSGNVVRSCIHCHHIGEAQREYFLQRGQGISEELLFPYPHPKIVGLTLDPQERATILGVEAGSAAANAGFQPGDKILTLSGQPLLSTADVQWVLHSAAADGAQVRAEVDRGGNRQALTLDLPAGWRRRGDLGWRPSTGLWTRMATGGMRLKELTPEEKTATGIATSSMALRATYIAKSDGPDGAAMKAGFKKGDIVISYDGHTDLLREVDVFRHGLNNRKPGDTVSATLLRDRQRLELTLPIQQ